MQNYYPLASSVMEVIFCFPGRSHVSVGTVHPSLLLPYSSSSSRWLSPNSIFRRIIGVISSHIHKLPQSRFPTPSLMLAIYLQSPWCHHFSHGLFVCDRMHLYLFISASSSLHEFGDLWQLGRLHLNTSQLLSIQTLVLCLNLLTLSFLSSPRSPSTAPVPTPARISPLRTASANVLLF